VTWPDQETTYCTLATVADVIEQRAIRPPAVIVVGSVVALAAPGMFSRRRDVGENEDTLE